MSAAEERRKRENQRQQVTRSSEHTQKKKRIARSYREKMSTQAGFVELVCIARCGTPRPRSRPRASIRIGMQAGIRCTAPSPLQGRGRGGNTHRRKEACEKWKFITVGL